MAFSLRQQWLNLTLVGAALALSLYVFWTRDRVTSTELEARARHVLGAFREDEITRVTITRKGETIVLEQSRDDAGSTSYRLLQPVTEPADPYAADKLLGSLEFATPARRIEPSEVDRSRFGLKDPKQVLSIDMGPIQYVLRFGGTAASPKDAVYVELLGTNVPRPGVMILSADLARELSPAADELREKQLVPYTSTTLERVVLDGTGGRRVLRRARTGAFHFDGQLGNRRVGRAAMDQLLVELSRAKAEHFLTIEQARAAQAGAEQIRLELWPRDASWPRAELTFGGACPASAASVVAVRSQPRPQAGCVPKSVFAGLSIDAERLLDRGLIALRADEIERLVIRHGDRSLALNRTPDGFRLEGSAQATVELEAGNRRLLDLENARGRLVDAPDLQKLGLVPGDGSVEVRSATERPPAGLPDERLRFSVRDGVYHVLREQDGAVLELGPESVRALSTDATLLRAPRVLEFKPSAVRELVVTTGAAQQRVVRSASGAYELAEPQGHAIDAALTSDVLDTLSTLDAERWIAEQERPEMGLAAPRLRISLQLDASSGDAGPPPELGLLVGSPTAGGYYARLTHDRAVFLLSRTVFDRLETLLLDRSVFLTDLAATRSIELGSKGRTIRLEKVGTDFVERGPTASLRPDQLAEIADVLASLRPEAAVQLGPERPREGLAAPVLRVRITSDGGAIRSFRIGAADSFHDITVRYARADGSGATYVIAESKLTPLLDLF